MKKSIFYLVVLGLSITHSTLFSSKKYKSPRLEPSYTFNVLPTEIKNLILNLVVPEITSYKDTNQLCRLALINKALNILVKQRLPKDLKGKCILLSKLALQSLDKTSIPLKEVASDTVPLSMLFLMYKNRLGKDYPVTITRKLIHKQKQRLICKTFTINNILELLDSNISLEHIELKEEFEMKTNFMSTGSSHIQPIVQWIEKYSPYGTHIKIIQLLKKILSEYKPT